MTCLQEQSVLHALEHLDKVVLTLEACLNRGQGSVRGRQQDAGTMGQYSRITEGCTHNKLCLALMHNITVARQVSWKPAKDAAPPGDRTTL